MTKYDADSATESDYWHDDVEHVLAEFSEKPFVGVRHRHEVVEQRFVVVFTDGVGVDIRWEARSEDTEKFPEEWGLVEEISYRDGRCRHDWHGRRRWLL